MHHTVLGPSANFQTGSDLSSAQANTSVDELLSSEQGQSSHITRSPKEGKDYIKREGSLVLVRSGPMSSLPSPPTDEMLNDIHGQLSVRDSTINTRGQYKVAKPPMEDRFYFEADSKKRCRTAESQQSEPTPDLVRVAAGGMLSGTIYWSSGWGGPRADGISLTSCTISDEELRHPDHRVLKFVLVNRPVGPYVLPKTIREDVTFEGTVTFQKEPVFQKASVGTGADYAEYLSLSNPDEDAKPCQVVECIGGRISTTVTYSTDATYFVISEQDLP